MNKHYVIWPIIMIAAFVAYFIKFDKEDKIKKAEIEAARVEEQAKRDAERERLKKLAAEENLKRAAEKAKEEAEKLADRRAKQEAKDQEVRDETASRQADIDANAKEKGLLEAKLAETRRLRLKTEAESFDAARAVELAKIERRTIEMDIQRVAGIVAAKVDASSLVEIPVFPTETAKK